MPRSDKRIEPGRLDGNASHSRGHTWSKYGEMATIEDAEDVVATIDIRDDDPAEADEFDVTEIAANVASSVREPLELASREATVWVVDRIIHGRQYHRVDRLVARDREHGTTRTPTL